MKQEATKYLQEYIDRMQAKGITPTMEDLNQKMGEFFRKIMLQEQILRVTRPLRCTKFCILHLMQILQYVSIHLVRMNIPKSPFYVR